MLYYIYDILWIYYNISPGLGAYILSFGRCLFTIKGNILDKIFQKQKFTNFCVDDFLKENAYLQWNSTQALFAGVELREGVEGEGGARRPGPHTAR